MIEIRRALGLLLISLPIYVAGCRLNELPFKEQYDLLRSVKAGMTESEVRKRLGEPTYVYDKSASPDRYCVNGWTCERRTINDHLLIFTRGEPIAYVYFDAEDQVEYVYVGGS